MRSLPYGLRIRWNTKPFPLQSLLPFFPRLRLHAQPPLFPVPVPTAGILPPLRPSANCDMPRNLSKICRPGAFLSLPTPLNRRTTPSGSLRFPPRGKPAPRFLRRANPLLSGSSSPPAFFPFPAAFPGIFPYAMQCGKFPPMSTSRCNKTPPIPPRCVPHIRRTPPLRIPEGQTGIFDMPNDRTAKS